MFILFYFVKLIISSQTKSMSLSGIRLPDGRPAPIDKNSSVIYKIVKPQAMPPPIPQLIQDMQQQQKLDQKSQKKEKK